MIQVLVTTYFLKKKAVVDVGKIPLKDKLEICKEYNDYITISNNEKGILYFEGHKIDIDEFLNGNIKVLDNVDESIFDNLFDCIKE